MARAFHPGMGQAVAERTILRKKKNNQWETWDDVAHRVALGNSLLCRTKEEQEAEYKILYKHLSKASILMSGRHLQHGDASQPERNMEVFTNCLDGMTKILTLEYGPIEISEIVNKRVTIKSADGEWREATIKNYGKQKLYKLSFGHPLNTEESKIIVYATRNHRWFLEDETITDNIQVGDYLKSAPIGHFQRDIEAERHGLVFGDGHSHKRRRNYAENIVSQGRDYITIRLCGEDKKYLDLFTDYSVTYPPHANGDPVVYVGKKQFWKDLPFTTDPSYIDSFIKGWWMADGYKTYNRNLASGGIEISTARKECVNWLKDYAAYAGYIITGISTKERIEGDGSFDNGKPLHCVRLAKGNRKKLLSIEEIKEEEFVYCLEEPHTTGFVLANGLLTGNCATSCTSFALFYLLMNGCFRSGTLIKMANGQLKPIETIEPGELVISFDENTKKFTTNIVTQVHTNQPKPMVKITLSSGKEIVCTEDHKFMTKDGKWVMAKNLEGEDLANE